jgi:hypothetical protein
MTGPARLRIVRHIVPAVAPICLLAVMFVRAQNSAASEMAKAAADFLSILTPTERTAATFRIDDKERINWHVVPRARQGVALKTLDERGRQRALGLLRTGLSQAGYRKAEAVMALENVLRAIEGRDVRDPGLYFVTVFGTPGTEPWGWRFEGHHLSLNFTIAGGRTVAWAPAFFGAHPALVKDGPQQGQRALRDEEDTARALILALPDAKRATAMVNATAPQEIVTFETPEASPLSPTGLAAASMTTAERELLNRVLEAYLGRMSPDLASARRAKLESAGMDKIHFAWAGETGVGRPHYYRVQGPTFLIEYDDTQNDANHIHSVWRDFDGDFGRDLLREHYRAEPHPAPGG